MLGALRGEPVHVVRMVAGLVALIAGTVLACWALLTLRDATSAAALTVTVLGGSAVTLGFALAPLMAGTSDPLDPRRFSVFGLPPAPLAAVLLLAGLLSVPTFVLIALGVCLVLVWQAHGVPWPAGAFGVMLGILTCSLLARVSMAVTAAFIRERRSRELTGVFVLAVLVVVVPVGVFLSSLEWRGTVPPPLRAAVGALALTPVGASWAYPAERVIDDGAPTAALTVAVLTVAILACFWALIVRHALTSTERPVAVREHGGLGWFGVAPGTPGGGVAARSLVYWFRDSRYLVNIVAVPIAAAITMLPLLIAGVPFEYAVLVPVPLAALFFGWLPHNDLAYDSSAVWMHIGSGIRGVSDRIGRLVPVLLVAVPVLAVAVPLTVAGHGRWALLPAMVGVCASLFLSALGLSSISSVVAPYAVARPGDSPFQQPQRVGAGGAVAQGVVFLGAIVLSAPALWWGWLALTGDYSQTTAALWSGLAIGVVVFAVGISIGASVFTRRSSRLMEFAEST
ncbi:hypothetical protein CVS47_01790 [Microbacterium lemovicicum]|uniref:ABC-2 type transport system permease protein n=1 Tax=Microbacterium lemovicicum TaxID=1072463 RepID=A0A3Q9IZN2_9MICO|nr:hypothetical protein [Microbacterium lemovicicum]AZS37159.1 hypothetical protein CVS47_01790 [Microbacterium lemovicicum]